MNEAEVLREKIKNIIAQQSKCEAQRIKEEDTIKEEIKHLRAELNREVNNIYNHIGDTVENYKKEEREEVNKMNGVLDDAIKTFRTAIDRANKFKDTVLYTVVGVLFSAVVAMGSLIVANFNKIFP
jgi:chaperonin cofactor prefoldin